MSSGLSSFSNILKEVNIVIPLEFYSNLYLFFKNKKEEILILNDLFHL